MTEAEKQELINKCDNAIFGMCTTNFKPYLCQSISRAINSMPVTPSVSETLDKISAEIRRMDYHTVDCDVLVDQEEVLYIIEQYKKGELI